MGLSLIIFAVDLTLFIHITTLNEALSKL